jgi:hypothetical protein
MRKMWPRVDTRRLSAVVINVIANLHISMALGRAFVFVGMDSVDNAVLILLRLTRRRGMRSLSDVLMTARRSESILRQDATNKTASQESLKVVLEAGDLSS